MMYILAKIIELWRNKLNILLNMSTIGQKFFLVNIDSYFKVYNKTVTYFLLSNKISIYFWEITSFVNNSNTDVWN